MFTQMIRTALTCLLMLSPIMVSAQSSSSASSASSVDTARAEQSRRMTDFRRVALSATSVYAEWKAAERSFVDERTDLWQRCRLDIRRANRYDQLPTTLRCERATLTLQLELLRSVRTLIQRDTEHSDDLIATVDALTEALSAIIDAIDLNVFGSVEDIKETRMNLHTHYRIPFLNALYFRDVRKLQSWAEYLRDRGDRIQKEHPESGGLEQLEQAFSCLNTFVAQSNSIIDNKDTSLSISQLSTSLETCTQLLRGAYSQRNEANNESSSSSASSEAMSSSTSSVSSSSSIDPYNGDQKAERGIRQRGPDTREKFPENY